MHSPPRNRGGFVAAEAVKGGEDEGKDEKYRLSFSRSFLAPENTLFLQVRGDG